MVDLVRQTEHVWLDDPTCRAPELMDVVRVKALLSEGLAVVGPTDRCFVHGDLIPGNLLVHSGRLTGILDWGGAGYGDPAQDLAPAWSVLDEAARARFRRTVGADDDERIRARTIELAHAVAGVVYYVPRRHALGDVMAATLGRILDER